MVNETSTEDCTYLFNRDKAIKFKSKPAIENNFTSKKYIALIHRNNTQSNYIFVWNCSINWRNWKKNSFGSKIVGGNWEHVCLKTHLGKNLSWVFLNYWRKVETCLFGVLIIVVVTGFSKRAKWKCGPFKCCLKWSFWCRDKLIVIHIYCILTFHYKKTLGTYEFVLINRIMITLSKFLMIT